MTLFGMIKPQKKGVARQFLFCRGSVVVDDAPSFTGFSEQERE
jgi:hypothetical protein